MAICSLSLQLGSSESSAKLKNKNLSFKSALLVAYVQPYPPPPPRKLKVKQKRGNFYANLTLIVFRDATLIYEKCRLIIFLRSGTFQREGYRDKQRHCSEFIFHFSGKFANQRPISNIYFALRILEKIQSEKRTMFDQHCAYGILAVSVYICKKCHGRRKKLDRLPQSLLRDSYAPSVKKEQLFSQSKELLRETTSFNLSD